MTNIFSSLVLLFAVWGLTLAEINYSKNLFTPFTVTAWPFAIVSILANLFVVRIGFLPVTVRANLFILLNLIVIWIVGFLLFQKYKKPFPKIDFAEVFAKYKDFRFFIIFLSWIVILSSILKFYSILREKGLLFASTGEFEKMMSRGATAHLTVVGMVLLILLVLILWNSQKNWLDYLTMIFLGLSITAFMIKFPIVWAIMAIFFIRNIHAFPNIQIRRITYIAGFIVIVFIINMLVLFSGWSDFSITDRIWWERIVGWLFNYLFSGPILLDQWLNLPFIKPWWSLFIVPINFGNVIMGNPERLRAVDYVSPGFAQVHPEFFSNVGTSFGAYYLIGGFAFTILLTIIIASLSYIFYIKSFHSENPITIFIASIFLIMGTFSFFGQFFALLPPYEMIIFYIFFIIAFELIIKVKKYSV